MNHKILALVFSIGMALFIFSGCKKRELLLPSVTFSVEGDTVFSKLNESVRLQAKVNLASSLSQSWQINGIILSTTDRFEHQFDSAGRYRLHYSASNAAGTFERNFVIDVEALIREGGSNQYVTTLFEFLPAPGQFINVAPGNMESANGILGKTGMVCLGAWGGAIVLGFDHTVMNLEGDDIKVGGNAMANFAEPGIVYVMQDANGNGKPDDTWYELAGSEWGKKGYRPDYSITYFRPIPANGDIAWKDSDGASGFVKRNAYHSQSSYYPDWVTTDQYTLKGALLPKDNINMSNPQLITSMPFAFGYADNVPGGNNLDISNAVDANGKKISLKGIDFIKIQTGIVADLGWLGELSTEVTSVQDLHFTNTLK